MLWEQLLPALDNSILQGTADDCTICTQVLDRLARGNIVGKFEEERLLFDLAQLAVHGTQQTFVFVGMPHKQAADRDRTVAV